MSAFQYVLICEDGEVKEFNHLNEARAWAADLAAEGTTAHQRRLPRARLSGHASRLGVHHEQQ